MISVVRVFLTIIKLFMMFVVTAMIMFQIPELQYDFGTKEPLCIKSADELSIDRFPHSTFVSIQGKGDFIKAATFAKYGVQYTYFLLDGFDNKLVVRTHEAVSEKWENIEFHVGRLRPFDQMPFSRSVRGGFRKLYDVGIDEDAFFLARDDVPKLSGWSIGAVSLVSIIWCLMAYFFFVHGLVTAKRVKKV